MKPATSLAFAAALMALAAGTAAASPAFVAGDLHLRTAPGTGNPSIAVIPGGSTVDVRNCGGGWCAVY